MSRHARIVGGIVAEVWTDGGLGITPADVFVPLLAVQFVEVPSYVEAGWLRTDDGWEAPPPVPVVPEVPQSVGPFQARAALLAAGLLDDVEALIADPETDRAIKIAWEYATEFKRDSQFIAQMAGALGLTEEDIDGLFIAAAEIEA